MSKEYEIGRKWLEDSRLEVWFPLSAERLVDLERRLEDAASYARDQAKQFDQCAKIHANRGNASAEAVALRASEILNRIVSDLVPPTSTKP